MRRCSTTTAANQTRTQRMASIDMEKLPLAPARRRFGFRRVIVVIFSLLVLHRVFLLMQSGGMPHPKSLTQSDVVPNRGYGEMYRLSWSALTKALQNASPSVKSLGSFEKVEGISVESVDQPTTIDVMTLTPHDLAALKASHKKFVHSIQEGSQLSVIYQGGQQGIVLTATYNELPQVIIQLRLLRRTRSSLPVEVFLLSADDYDAKICTEVLPKLDAHCTILEELLDTSSLPLMPQSRKERKIQPNEPLNKLLAIYFSRFEDVLLLDPTTLVYNNPDMMLKEEPFLSTGMLIWPDFWASTVSPKLFAVQGAPVQKPNRRDNIRTVDLGQIVISKSHHSATLLLAIYYTFYGPGIYDALQQQSSSGEHGSLAIKCAARYLETPYYMIKRHVEAVGYPDMDQENDAFKGIAMLQAFASDDFHRLPKDRQRPVFVRQNNPALHPARILNEGVTIFKKKDNPKQLEEDTLRTSNSAKPAGMQKVKGDSPAAADNLGVAAKGAQGNADAFAIPAFAPTDEDRGLHHRMWEWFGGRYESNGWRDPDPERALWEEIATVACVDYSKFRVWPSRDALASQTTCERINYHRGQLGWQDFFVMK